LTREIVASLHSLCNLIIDRATLELCGGAQAAAILEIVAGVGSDAIGEFHPTIEKKRCGDIRSERGRFSKRAARNLDLPMVAAGNQGYVDRQIPDIIAGKWLEHFKTPLMSGWNRCWR